MATRMQQRRGTAAQWAAADPVLNAGEIGFESDTGKFKIGDGTNHWDDLNYFLDSVDQGGSIVDYIPLTQRDAASGVATLDASKNLNVPGASIIVEGATDNTFETTLTVTDPTADRTITFPDVTGTVALTSDITVTASSTNTFSNKSISLGSNTVTSTLAQLNTAVSDADVASLAGTETLTNKTIAFSTNTLTGVAPLAAPAFTGDATAVNLTISGNLTVDGTTTNINSTSLVVEDKNIVLGDTATPTDTTADGGGITLKGLTDKTFNWVDATDAWTSSEHINLASGKTLKYNGTDLVAAQSGNSGKFLTTDGTSTSWATVSGYSAPTLGSTSIASGATVTTIVGLTKVRSDVFTTLDASGFEVDIETMAIMGAF